MSSLIRVTSMSVLRLGNWLLNTHKWHNLNKNIKLDKQTCIFLIKSLDRLVIVGVFSILMMLCPFCLLDICTRNLVKEMPPPSNASQCYIKGEK